MFKCERCGIEITEGMGSMICNKCWKCDDCGSTTDLCYYLEGILCNPCHQARVDKRISAFKGFTRFTSEIICPYCGHIHRDSWDISANADDYACDDCGNEFSYERHITIEYSTEKKR